ncbi:MAG: DUF885 domain-containing protein [Ginsengibacter sp.]
MKKLVFIITSSICLVSSLSAQGNFGNQQFDLFKERFVLAILKVYPDQATAIGYHAYDSILVVPDNSYIKMQVAFSTNYLDSLYKFSYADLNEVNKTDYKIIESQLKSTIWQTQTAREFVWNPSVYNVASVFAYILNEPYDKLENRLKNFYRKLELVPEYYVAAKANIRDPAKELTDLAIEQLTGGLSIFEQDLSDSLKRSLLPQSLKDTIGARAASAAAAIKSFVVWLQSLPMDNSRTFRLGKALYEKQFEFDIQSSYSVEALYKAAQQRKEYLLNEMEKKADLLWKKYFDNTAKPGDKFELIRKVIDTISSNHVKPRDFQSSIEEQLPRLTAFVIQKNLLYMDPSKPLQVRKEPGYMAGVAGASISAPGPFEKNVSTYYNVGTLEGWTPERSESYLREYNNYTLQILNIHEGIPGHYVQLVFSNKSPSIIKSVFANGATIEGWAVYSELMMMENGYNNSPEMWLMYYKWNLRTVCNTILDISVHTKDMTKEEAMDLLVRQAFQQQAEAEGKWKRVRVTHVQLTSYFNGFYEILQLRNAYKKKLGKAYTLKKFNEKFLSYGSAPVKYIKAMMLFE